MVRVVAGAWIRDGKVLAAERGLGRADAGLWELPGGKVEPGESDADALARELAEELGVVVQVGAWLGTSRTERIELVAYVVAAQGEPAATEHSALAWLGPEALDTVPWADADLPLLAPLAARLGAG